MNRQSTASRAAALAVLVLVLGCAGSAPAPAAAPSGARPEPFATFEQVPVGVAASRDGRVFLAFSRAIDPMQPFSVAEVRNGLPVPFPPGFRQDDGPPAPDRLLAVQALTVDARNRLWILDSAKVGTNAIEPGTAKLIAWDLTGNRLAQTIEFPPSVAGATAFLNDVRIDLSRGSAGVAYLTDASAEGPNGIVVVDLATGTARRRLNDHPSTKPDPSLVPAALGHPLIQKSGPAKGMPIRLGADGIALAADGRYLYYSPLTSRGLYRVDAAALADDTRSDADVAGTVEDLGSKGFAADGLLEDAQGRVYVTDFENSSIHRRSAAGEWETVMRDARIHWPDTLALMADGTLLFTATQIDLSPRIRGFDRRMRPFVVYRLGTDSAPVMRE